MAPNIFVNVMFHGVVGSTRTVFYCGLPLDMIQNLCFVIKDFLIQTLLHKTVNLKKSEILLNGLLANRNISLPTGLHLVSSPICF